ncbi:MAG: hypothetical protein ACMUJM_04780 [bacterium]
MIQKKSLLLIIIVFMAWALFMTSSVVRAQDWAAMPPYNLLWPLWAPVYSPVDTVTNLPTPLLSEVTRSTILPVQPVYLFNPEGYEFPMGFIQPWLLYNSPTGVVYFDTVFGINPFPPPEFVDPITGGPLPLALPLNYSLLAIPPLSLALYTFELGNVSYMLAYGIDLGIDPYSLLTFTDVYGTPGVLTALSW